MPAEATDGLPLPQRYWAILTVALAVLLAVMDGAIANIALPTIARDLHATPAASIWVVNAYQLTITICLLPFASLGEIYGFGRVYRSGLLVFTLASLACTFSDSLLTLTVARVIQGFGAAGILSVNSALVRFIYPRRLLGQGIGINAMVVAFSAAIGPSVAASILSLAHWPYLFAINVPIGALALLIATWSLPATPTSSRRFDLPSAVLSALTLGLLVTSIDGFAHGEGAVLIVLELLGATGCGIALVLRQLSEAAPLLPVDLLRIPIFALSIATSICSFIGQMLAYVCLPFLFEGPLGRSQVMTGLLMTPWPVTVAIVAPISGRLADRTNPGLLGGVGLAIMAAGLASLALLPADPGNWNIAWRMSLSGFGFALFQSPNNRAILNAAPRTRSGGAGGMLSTARLLGQTMGASLMALIFGLAGRHATTDALAVAAALSLLAAGVSCLRLVPNVA